MLIDLVSRLKRRLILINRRAAEKRRLTPLYNPDAADLDLEKHIDEAIEWLKRAQDSGSDRGVSYGVPFGADFEASYPETTGYICRTFLEQEERTGDSDLLRRAIEMGDWEIRIQMAEGAVMGGTVNPNPTPAVFNTGMVLLGWTALYRRTAEERFRMAARRAAEWLVEVQESDGNWTIGNSRYASSKSTLYNVKAAWGLCEAGFVTGEERFIHAAIRNAEYCISKQHENGWFPSCCLSVPEKPLLHTIAYTMQGLMGIAKLTGRVDFLSAAKRTADSELTAMGENGFLPGRQTCQFEKAVEWCCPSASAQTATVWADLYGVTGSEKYRQAVQRVNRYLMARHDIRNRDPRLRGGVTGSWPVWGNYGRLSVLNWATKYFVDALTAELEMERKPEVSPAQRAATA